MQSTASSVTPLRDSDPEPVRVAPYNTEAEQALLGAIFRNNLAHGRVSDFLEAEHFGNAVHARIYAAIGKLIERGQIANPVTLKNLFDQDGALAEIGGAQYLTRLAEFAVTIINAEDYGRRIHDLHLRRQLIGLGRTSSTTRSATTSTTTPSSRSSAPRRASSSSPARAKPKAAYVISTTR